MPSSSFSLVAPFYDQLAYLVFGRAIKISTTKNYKIYTAPESQVLIIGGGTGWILKELLQQTSCKSIVYLEASDKMLHKAQQLISKKDIADIILNSD